MTPHGKGGDPSSLLRPTLILGASGQIGSALLSLLGNRGVGLTRKEADLSHLVGSAEDGFDSLLATYSPSSVINAAAYTQVDRAETEEELAHQMNAEVPTRLAQACAKRGIPLVHFSTDYVFSGEGEKPWSESDLTGPLNAYGRTKLAGEKGIQGAGGKYLIFRTSWVYDGQGKNFLNTILRLAHEKETLKIVSDQKGAPSYALHLARATLTALERAEEIAKVKSFPSGLYHFCNFGTTSWFEFAQEICRLAREKGESLLVKKIEPILTVAYPTPAQRPLNSRLDMTRLKTTFDILMPHWEEGLRECMETR